MTKHQQIYCIALVAIGSVLAMVLNHSSIEFGYYAPESTQQASALNRGRLTRVGLFVVGGDMNGSVVPPAGLANDLRTLAIDGILSLQAIALVVAIRRGMRIA
jgi:hypothetical protein